MVYDLILHLSNPVTSLGLAFTFVCVLVVGSFVQSVKKNGSEHVKKGESVRSQDIIGDLGNLDHAPARRRVRAEFQEELKKLNHPFFQVCTGLCLIEREVRFINRFCYCRLEKEKLKKMTIIHGGQE